MNTKIGLLVLLTAIAAGCIHKPSGPVSSWERVNVNLAALAQLNQDVAKGLIVVQQAGTITVQQAAPILDYQETVAKDHMALENIFSAGSAQAVSQSDRVHQLLEKIKIQGTALIQSGGLGVKNPKSQQLFTQDLQGIVNLADLVLEDFQLVKGN
jgi:hypothetical protein